MVTSIKIYCDSGVLPTMAKYANDPQISGFTTNPSLLKASGIKRYSEFAKQALELVKGKPISFEVLADDFPTMYAQAREIASWGENVWIKIPITNTKGESSIELIDSLNDLQLNITAVMTRGQLDDLSTVDRANHIISVFCGRISDAGYLPPMIPRGMFHAKLLWASTRELYNINNAENWGFDIITMTPDLIAKLPLRGKDLTEYSLETVKQFHEDGKGITF